MEKAMTTMAGATPVRRQIDILKGMLNAPSVQEQFRNALHDKKDIFVASLIDLYTGDKQLQACEPKLVVAEALRAAALNLPINKALGFSYIVVYNNSHKLPDGTWQKVPTPTFIPGYKGYIQLAMRTGQYKTINADVVYEGELSVVDKLTGGISFDGHRTSDKVVGYFAYFELLNGFAKCLYMSVEDMARYAKRYSKGIRAQTTVEQLEALANSGAPGKAVGWEGNFNDMAIKTVIRRLLGKYGYLSVEMASAIEDDVKSDKSDADEQTPQEAPKVVDMDAASFDPEAGEEMPEQSQPSESQPQPQQAPSELKSVEEEESPSF